MTTFDVHTEVAPLIDDMIAKFLLNLSFFVVACCMLSIVSLSPFQQFETRMNRAENKSGDHAAGGRLTAQPTSNVRSPG
jgi:hypothetical protein